GAECENSALALPCHCVHRYGGRSRPCRGGHVVYPQRVQVPAILPGRAHHHAARIRVSKSLRVRRRTDAWGGVRLGLLCLLNTLYPGVEHPCEPQERAPALGAMRVPSLPRNSPVMSDMDGDRGIQFPHILQEVMSICKTRNHFSCCFYAPTNGYKLSVGLFVVAVCPSARDIHTPSPL